ncbi:ATP-binding protein [Kribbella qitaiheensis]|uniref:ATP-binding protein n=2 Tax=Kribbella qitaiheensis TaxID=1544730 RepID=A0A7G6X9N6_9ACTN|nr:ATP-binding protein [Kribbella qitaiheensis]
MVVVVSGAPGSGKTTLAHEVAGAIGCPAICRDEIKEGMVHATPDFVQSASDPLSLRTLSTFFDVIGLLIGRGTTVVAEAAFQDRLWRPGLAPLLGSADVRIIQCTVSPEAALDRIATRTAGNPLRRAHEDPHTPPDLDALRRVQTNFDPITLPVPTLGVDTTDGYHPALPEILAFLAR